MNLIVEDKDDIELGTDLLYTTPINEGQDNFHKLVTTKSNEAKLKKAACLTKIPVKDVRIFICDTEDLFPYNIQVNGEKELFTNCKRIKFEAWKSLAKNRNNY